MLIDLGHNRFSLNPMLQSTKDFPTEYETFSDRIARMFPTYRIDDLCRIRPGLETPVLNFAYLKDLLLSHDLSRNTELEWVSGKNLRFLDGTNIFGN